MGKIYRAYRDDTGSCLVTLESEKEQRQKGLLPSDAELLWEIEAATCEEASAIYHLRMGFEPYVPQGEWQPCPKCEAVYYPEGYGECWKCGYRNW